LNALREGALLLPDSRELNAPTHAAARGHG
jgi:hypothetical protein